jgi:D-cysteine desulfhydrase
MNTENTPIQRLGFQNKNTFFIKREDLIPFSFGGNKARKAELFFKEIDARQYNCVVTYGSSSSNHCRVVSNMCAQRGLPCYIISPEEASAPTFNSEMMALFGAKISVVPVDKVHDTIESFLENLRAEGKNPYFIPGGGHGNIGTQAYVICYNEIREWEKENGIHFDYIFHASGTGTTQAGLVCGQLINRDQRKIVGISIARKNPRGRQVVVDSIYEYLASIALDVSAEQIESKTIFDDSYVGEGYGDITAKEVINNILTNYGIPLDSTYTGKAFKGMLDYLTKNKIENKNILFLHTGGTPLFFDFLTKERTTK